MAHDVEALRENNRLSDFIGARLNLKREGQEYAALCPFHKERHASLKVNDAKQIWKCFGCDKGGDIFDFVQEYHRCDFPTACEYLGGAPIPTGAPPTPRPKLVHPAVEPLRAAEVPDSHTGFVPGQPIQAWKPEDNRQVVYTPDAVYDYKSATGETTHYVIRINFAEGRKIFVPLRPVWRGESIVWATAHMDTPRPLYGLERLQSAGDVYLCEGEKSADACAVLLSVVALSAPKGQVDYAPLTGRDVIVWADADEAGQKHAERVASALVGVANAVRIVPWDQSKPKGWDAADALAEGAGEFGVGEWIDATALLISEPIADPDDAPVRFAPEIFDGSIPPPRPWAYGNFLMYKAVTGVAAPPGVGKTTFSFQLGIAFALDMPFGTWLPARGGGGKVWLYNGEEPKDELNRRFIAACQEMGVNESVVAPRFMFNSGLDQRLNFLALDPRSGEPMRSPDVDIIKQMIVDHDIKLFIIDPLIEFHNVKEDTEGFHAMGAILREIGHDCDCSVLFFHHTPKASNSDNAAGDMNALRGGGPIVGVARFVGTMFNMTVKDAEEYGVPAKERYRYVRFDDAKANMTLVGNSPQWWAKLGIGINNASDDRPADTIGVLRFDPLSSVNAVDPEIQAVKAAVKAKERSVKIDRIAAEIVRICLDSGYTDRDMAAPLDTILKALDIAKTGVKSTVAREMVTAEMGQGCVIEDNEIVIFNVPRGKLLVRKVYVEKV